MKIHKKYVEKTLINSIFYLINELNICLQSQIFLITTFNENIIKNKFKILSHL